MEFRYESAVRQAQHLAWEAHVVLETQIKASLLTVDTLSEEYG